MPHPQRIAALVLGGDQGPWEALGFSAPWVVGSTRLEFDGGKAHGIRAWELAGTPAQGDVDGLPTSAGAVAEGQEAPHPNGVIGIDHVVVVTPSLERTTAAFEALGVPCRRVREAGEVRQGFFRFGEVIVEVVETARAAGDDARFWGLTLVVSDLDATAARLGDHLGEIRDAVQPGRRIATVRREAGHGVPLALMTPGPA